MHIGRAYFTKIHNCSYCFRYKLLGKKLQIAVFQFCCRNRLWKKRSGREKFWNICSPELFCQKVEHFFLRSEMFYFNAFIVISGISVISSWAWCFKIPSSFSVIANCSFRCECTVYLHVCEGKWGRVAAAACSITHGSVLPWSENITCPLMVTYRLDLMPLSPG